MREDEEDIKRGGEKEDQLGRTRTRNSQASEVHRVYGLGQKSPSQRLSIETGTTKRRSLQPECVTARK